MRRWWIEARVAADHVAGRADLWLPGALAWSLTVGWLPILAAVARPPTVADLTFLGARVYTSGAWPWNAVAALAGVVLVAVALFVLVALAETAIAGGWRRGLSAGGVSRVAAIGFVTAAPALAATLATATAFVLVAMREFNSPAAGDPLLRSLWAIAPFLAVVAVAWIAGSVAHAAALREAVLGRVPIVHAIAAVPRRLRRAGSAAAVAAVASVAFRLVHLVVTTALLLVLWQPIAIRLAVEGIDAAVVPLLVGFVAIWLCLVLAGGALHAWTSVTWTGVLGADDARRAGAGPRTQGAPYRP
jgi:hypothetical protein